jgi:hypothetical protein
MSISDETFALASPAFTEWLARFYGTEYPRHRQHHLKLRPLGDVEPTTEVMDDAQTGAEEVKHGEDLVLVCGCG